MIDINSTVLHGRLAVAPELREFDSGARIARLLVTVRVDHPRRRVDVIPVTAWADQLANFDSVLGLTKGDRIEVYGSAQRRYWESPDGKRNRLEIVAESVITSQYEEEE